MLIHANRKQSNSRGFLAQSNPITKSSETQQKPWLWLWELSVSDRCLLRAFLAMLLPWHPFLSDSILPTITLRLLSPRTSGRVFGMVLLLAFRSFLADSTNLHEKIFHYSQLTAACLVPVSFVLAPSALCVSSFERFLRPRFLLITFCAFCILSTDALVWAISSVTIADLYKVLQLEWGL